LTTSTLASAAIDSADDLSAYKKKIKDEKWKYKLAGANSQMDLNTHKNFVPFTDIWLGCVKTCKLSISNLNFRVYL